MKKTFFAVAFIGLALALIGSDAYAAARMKTIYPMWRNRAWSADSTYRTIPADYATWVKADTTAPIDVSNALWFCNPARLTLDSTYICISVLEEQTNGSVLVGRAGHDSTTVKLQTSTDGKTWVTQTGNLTYLSNLATLSWGCECLRMPAVSPPGITTLSSAPQCCVQFLRVIVNWDTPTTGLARRARVKVNYPQCPD